MSLYAAERFTPDEELILRRYVTNLDLPVFALVNLPEVVKGALFARYSRSAKSLRRLFLDEFVGDLDISGDPTVDATVGLRRAEELYDRVFLEYGDDSVAQLGGVHLACEQASNLLTKILEWGRLMAYLEQSTRYIAYDARLTNGRYRYYRDPGRARLAPRRPLRRRHGPHVRHLRRAAAGHAGVLHPTSFPEAGRLRLRLPPVDQGQGLRRPARPAAGGRHVERRHLRHRPGLRGAPPAHAGPPAARGPGLRRADARRAAQGDPVVPQAGRPPRPGAARGRPTWRRTAKPWRTWPTPGPRASRTRASESRRPMVTLVDFDPDGEDKVVAAMLYPHTDLPEDQLGGGSAHVGWRRGLAVMRPTPATAPTAATAPVGLSSGRPTASTCCPTTGRSVTCSATGCSPSNGRTWSPPRLHLPGAVIEAGLADDVHECRWRARPQLHDALAERFPEPRPPTPSPWPTGCATRCSSTPARPCTCSSCAPGRRATRLPPGVPGDAPAHRRAGRPPGRRRADGASSTTAPTTSSA